MVFLPPQNDGRMNEVKFSPELLLMVAYWLDVWNKRKFSLWGQKILLFAWPEVGNVREHYFSLTDWRRKSSGKRSKMMNSAADLWMWWLRCGEHSVKDGRTILRNNSAARKLSVTIICTASSSNSDLWDALRVKFSFAEINWFISTKEEADWIGVAQVYLCSIYYSIRCLAKKPIVILGRVYRRRWIEFGSCSFLMSYGLG